MDKKISFGFSKLSKKPNFSSQSTKTNHKDLIDCLEGSQIKVKNEIKKVEKGPLVIPLPSTKKNLTDRIQEAVNSHSVEDKLALVKEEINEEFIQAATLELTIEQQAVQALIQDAKNWENSSETTATKVLKLDLKEESLALDGAAEATLDDYDNIPINDYGMAMLRGMGWKEGMGIGKNPKALKTVEPHLRPKGLGLGANKMVNAESHKDAVDKNGKQLLIVKGAYCKVIAGANKGCYCQVQGLDDENSRVIVKTSKDVILTLNEFLVVSVTKEEYNLGSKVINSAKYEEYKDREERREMKNETKETEDKRSKRYETKDKIRERRSRSLTPSFDNNRTSKKYTSEDSDSHYNKKNEIRREKSEENKGKYKAVNCRKHRQSKSISPDHRQKSKHTSKNRSRSNQKLTRTRSRSRSFNRNEDYSRRSKKESRCKSRRSDSEDSNKETRRQKSKKYDSSSDDKIKKSKKKSNKDRLRDKDKQKSRKSKKGHKSKYNSSSGSESESSNDRYSREKKRKDHRS